MEDSEGLFVLEVKNENGLQMPIRRMDEPKKYRYRGRSGKAVYEANIPLPGQYIFTGKLKQKGQIEMFNLYFDKGFSQKRSRTVIAAQAILLFPIIASLILFLYAYSKNRVKNE